MMSLGEKGKMTRRDLWRSSCPTPLLKAGSAGAVCPGLNWFGVVV